MRLNSTPSGPTPDEEQLLLDLDAPYPPTLDNFVVGSNTAALGALRAWIEGEDASPSLLYLWSDWVCGKTHLLRAAATALASPCIQAGDVTPALLAARLEGLQPPIVIIDDVDRLSAASQRDVFALFNEVRDRKGRLLVSANCAPRDLPLRPDLASRLALSLVFEMQALGESDQLAALAAHAARRDLILPEEVLHYLLSRSKRDLRSLVGWIDALYAYGLNRRKELTVGLMRRLMAEKALGDVAKLARLLDAE